jgi:signal transduction histidine kinase
MASPSVASIVEWLLEPALRAGETSLFIRDFRSGRIRILNRAMAARLGLQSNLTIEALNARVHPADLRREDEYAEQQARRGLDGAMVRTFRLWSATGDWRLINLRSRVLRRRPDGTIWRTIGLVTDITDFNATADALAAADEALARAEQNERRDIGRELHDSTVQHLAAANLGLAALEERPSLAQDDRRRLETIRQSIATAQAEIRSFSFLLHPASLEEEGLEACLRRLCIGFGRRAGLKVDFAVNGAPRKMHPDAEHALLRVTQESLMNVHRHSGASRASVILRHSPGEVLLEISDDGVGFQGSRGEGDDALGVGIQGMRARMLKLGGGLTIHGGQGGLRVTARAPVVEA